MRALRAGGGVRAGGLRIFRAAGKPAGVRCSSPSFLRLLALVFLFQAVMAPALCIGQAQAASLTMEICGPEGMRTAVLDGGDEAPSAGHGSFCAVCAGLPQGAEAPTPIVPVPAWAVIADAVPVPHDTAGLARARAPPQQPRAPPRQG